MSNIQADELSITGTSENVKENCLHIWCATLLDFVGQRWEFRFICTACLTEVIPPPEYVEELVSGLDANMSGVDFVVVES